MKAKTVNRSLGLRGESCMMGSCWVCIYSPLMENVGLQRAGR